MVVFWALGVLCHELGHAAAGALAGYRVPRIDWGTGDLVFWVRIRALDLNIRQSPFGGLAFGFPQDAGRRSNVRRALFAAGGPAANVALACLGWELRGTSPFDFGDLANLRLPEALMYSNLALLVMALWPRFCAAAAGRVPSDGLALLTILGGPAIAGWFDRPRRAADPNAAHSRIARVFSLLCAAAAVVFGASAVLCTRAGWLAGPASTANPVPFWGATIVLAMLAAVSAGMSVRFWRRRDVPAVVDPGPDPFASVHAAYHADLSGLQGGMPDLRAGELHLRIHGLVERGAFRDALAATDAALAKAPGTPWLWIAKAQCHAGATQPGEAIGALKAALGIPGISQGTRAHVGALWARMLAEHDTPEAVRAAAGEVLATLSEPLPRQCLLESLCDLAISQGKPLWEEADGWSAEALALGEMPTLHGTRGVVLLNRGRMEEGESALRRCVETTAQAIDRAIGHAHLALCARRRGDVAAEQRHRAAALGQGHDDRVRSLLDSGPA